MATVTLRLPRPLAPFCGGRRELAVQGADVRSALQDAFSRHPLLRVHLLDESGALRDHLHLFLDQTDVARDLDRPLRDGDELTVLQAMSGGLGPTPGWPTRA